MTEMTFTQTDADALAAKLEACGLTETERRVLSTIFHRSAQGEDSEVEGFAQSFGLPPLGPAIFQAQSNAQGMYGGGGLAPANPNSGKTPPPPPGTISPNSQA
jgi:hypothetical protein